MATEAEIIEQGIIFYTVKDTLYPTSPIFRDGKRYFGPKIPYSCPACKKSRPINPFSLKKIKPA